MKVLMLGWEYPPHITGGLGTACEGLTTALARQGVEITFVVPKLFGRENAPHMRLVDSRGEVSRGGAIAFQDLPVSAPELGINSPLSEPPYGAPYWSASNYKEFVGSLAKLRDAGTLLGQRNLSPELKQFLLDGDFGSDENRYAGDIFAQVTRYAARVLHLFANETFDLIHAHDWMTFPAGVALAEVMGKPLVTHVHSLEQDRSGAGANPQIVEFERLGVSRASAVVAVSYYTQGLIQQHHAVPLEKISVVHNGVYSREVTERYKAERNWPAKIVLFLGRITFQKGPDYFVEAAARVVPHVPDVLFVMAGSGDMLPRMIDRVNQLGIRNHFYFPGFLKGRDVEEMFSLADVYVMPSVSEPFGISALEAISFNTPVIISRQSGVAEVLTHALKVDFWDVERLADLMMNAILYHELREDMVSMAREEVRRLHWDASAVKVLQLYQRMNG